MKKTFVISLICLLSSTFVFAQNLPIKFEGNAKVKGMVYSDSSITLKIDIPRTQAPKPAIMRSPRFSDSAQSVIKQIVAEQAAAYVYNGSYAIWDSLNYQTIKVPNYIFVFTSGSNGRGDFWPQLTIIGECDGFPGIDSLRLDFVVLPENEFNDRILSGFIGELSLVYPNVGWHMQVADLNPDSWIVEAIFSDSITGRIFCKGYGIYPRS
jgi:hypothetical protein